MTQSGLAGQTFSQLLNALAQDCEALAQQCQGQEPEIIGIESMDYLLELMAQVTLKCVSLKKLACKDLRRG